VPGLNADVIALIDEPAGAIVGSSDCAGALIGGVCGTGFGGVVLLGPGVDLRGRSMMMGAAGALAPRAAPFSGAV